MADPITKKIDTLPAMTDTVANNDKLIMLDVTASAVDMTKLITMSQIPISLPTQLGPNVVENAAIDDDAVQATKIKDYNVPIAKLAKSTGPFVMGRSNATATQAIEEIKPTLANTVLLGSATTTSYGKVTVNHIDSIAARTVIGNATNAAAAPTAIAAGTDGYVLRRSGDTIGFGKVKAAGIDSMTSAQLKAIVSDETGSGALVFATSPTLVTPALGTPSSGVLTNCTGLPTTGLVDKAVTEAKLGAIKRMIMIPVFGLEDAVIVKNFTRIMAWHPGLAGHVVTGAWAALLGAVSSSGSVGINLINAGGTMCSISIPASAWSAQSGTISTSLDDIASLATFSVNVTASGSGAIGLTIYLEVTG